MNGDYGDVDLVESLRTTLGRLEVALDVVDEAIVWVDGDGRVSWCNNAFDALVGRMRLENLSIDIVELLPLVGAEGPLPRDRHPAIQVLGEGGRLDGNYDLPGTPLRTLEVQASSVRSEGVVQTIMVLRDITDRLRREREAARRAAYVAMLHGVAARANEGNDLPDALRHALGCVAVHAGWRFAQVWLPDARGDHLHVSDPVYTADPDRFATLREVSLQLRLEAGQGLPGRVLETGAPLWVADVFNRPVSTRTRIAKVHGVHGAFAFPVVTRGRVRAVLEFFSDAVMPPDEVLLDTAREVGNQLARVFERADADQALRDANDELEGRVLARTAEVSEAISLLEAERETLRMRERAIDASTEGIVLFDVTSPLLPIQYVKAGYEAMFGWPREELLGQPASMLLGNEPDPKTYDTLMVLIQRGRAFTVDGEVPRRDGGTLWVRASFTPIHEPGGPITGWLVVDSDMSRQREVDRLKNELVSTVSHELRTPLGSMCGFAELLLAREHPPERQRKFLSIILEEGRRLGKLVDDFLDIQRIESGRQTYAFETADLSALVQEAVAAFGGVRGANVTVVLADPPLPPLRMDPARIRQVLANLISNAIKFSPNGGDVTVRTAHHPGWARVSVVDHGIGIPYDAQSRLFTRFFRVDNRDTRQIGGTGLGLALVKALVEAHGGQVGLESEPGVGSTFWFDLPTGEGGEEFPDLFA
jgi:PAS domain S-box-containing protein